jgi:iron(II)-dependent oxidoreductase
MTVIGTAEQIRAARAQTDSLFEILHANAIYDRPIPERHRLIFYLGHLEAFDWNQICRAGLGMPSFQPEFDKLFEFGIDPEPGTAARDQPEDWPATSEVLEYNHKVRAKVDAVLDTAPAQIVNVALEHRWMHAETLAYLLHAMPHDKKTPPEQSQMCAATGHFPGAGAMIDIAGGCVTLGQAPGQFGWDNEFGQHRVPVEPFGVSKYKVTNGEYLEFVKDGSPAPHFWIEAPGGYQYRGMFQSFPLPLDHPVYVTQEEARAYADWAGMSLATETQFHRAAYGTPEGPERPYPWGSSPADSSRGNFDFCCWDPIPVTGTPGGDSAFGVSQMVGNGWEWTSTEFGPFPGFENFSFYPGYSNDFFDGKHYVLKGGSPRTAACMLRRSYRNWFRPNYPYLYATFRLVDNG